MSRTILVWKYYSSPDTGTQQPPPAPIGHHFEVGAPRNCHKTVRSMWYWYGDRSEVARIPQNPPKSLIFADFRKGVPFRFVFQGTILEQLNPKSRNNIYVLLLQNWSILGVPGLILSVSMRFCHQILHRGGLDEGCYSEFRSGGVTKSTQRDTGKVRKVRPKRSSEFSKSSKSMVCGVFRKRAPFRSGPLDPVKHLWTVVGKTRDKSINMKYFMLEYLSRVFTPDKSCDFAHSLWENIIHLMFSSCEPWLEKRVTNLLIWTISWW